MAFRIKQAETEEEFRDYYHLRWKLLRAPWDQPKGSGVDDLEAQCIHLIAVAANDSGSGDRIIGVARLQFNSDSEAQIRYMAVAEPYRGNGVGRELVKAAELQAKRHAGAHSCESIVLDAREPAIGFYTKLGYQLIEKSYLLFDEIQHFRMMKKL